jgi:hypothetical protein
MQISAPFGIKLFFRDPYQYDGQLTRAPLLAPVNPFPELFPAFKDGQLLRSDLGGFARFGIASDVTIVLLDLEGAETPNLGPLIPGQGRCNGIEENIDDFFGIPLADLHRPAQFFDDVGLIQRCPPSFWFIGHYQYWFLPSGWKSIPPFHHTKKGNMHIFKNFGCPRVLLYRLSEMCSLCVESTWLQGINETE